MAGALAVGLSGGEEDDFAELPPPPGFTDTPPPEQEAATAEDEPRTARELFGHSCSTCHTLRAAGAASSIGPDLDEVRPSAAEVREAIRDGRAGGAMPPGLLTGRDAEQVSRYVARVAGEG